MMMTLQIHAQLIERIILSPFKHVLGQADVQMSQMSQKQATQTLCLAPCDFFLNSQKGLNGHSLSHPDDLTNGPLEQVLSLKE